MYTEAGDAAVDEVYSKIIKRHGPPQSEEEVYDLIKKISQEVIKMGKGQSNPCKNYDDNEEADMVEGFEEVRDTVVRENLYERLMDDMDEALSKRS
jgi:Ran GTPase-activating protein (RanGAP) involved in mRNA processing and transport